MRDDDLSDDSAREPSPSLNASPNPPPESAAAAFFKQGFSLRWVLGLLALVLISKFWAEPIVESVQHAITRGHERAKAEVAKTQLAKLNDTSEAFRLVAHSVGPSVVHIDTYRPAAALEAEGHDEWAFLYKDRPQALRSTGQGSGVIADAEGYILTNYHVIQKASAIYVKLSDGRLIQKCEVIGVDPLTDLAVIRISASGLSPAPWGDSDVLEVGDWVLAVGNPFGLDRSVTAGIVSAKQRRQVVDSLPYQDFLQTDAAVNPGNSGGPLVNLRGEVVGINTAIVGESYQGISFAIPSEIAQDVYQRLKATGKVARGWLGVSLDELSEQQAEKLNAGQRRGVWLRGVLPNSPARTAGLVADDIVLEFDGQKVLDPAELSLLVARAEVNSKVVLRILRDGEVIELEATLGERPGESR